MFYFRYRILNTLRDELLLTMASAKMTLFHLICLGIPMAGLGIGVGEGFRTHSILRGFVAASAGVALGVCLSWMLPRSIWNMLRFFGRKGWLLQPQSVSSATILSLEEFRTRHEAFDRDATRQGAWWIIAFIAWVALGPCLLFIVEWVFGRDSILAGIAGLAVVAFFAALVVWVFRAHRRLVKLHGLVCPNCDCELSDVAGGGIVVTFGFCRQCGAKAIDVGDDQQLPRYLDMT